MTGTEFIKSIFYLLFVVTYSISSNIIRGLSMQNTPNKFNFVFSDEESIKVEREALDYVEEKDEFEIESKQGIDFDSVKEGYAGLQDLLSVIKDAELEEALPQVMTLLKLGAVTPLTSVHCERVFSRMKRVISDSRSRMKQSRKEQLLLLQVEHKILRHLNAMPNFKENVIARFKSYNARRFERFSKK